MARELSRSCEVGDRVAWTTIGGISYCGILIAWDSNVAVVKLDDGKEKCVEC